MSQSLTTMPTTRMRLRQRFASAAHYPHKTVWCVFQPHTYSRTKILLTEFAEALSHADKVVLADIYAARETDTLGISSLDLKHEIEKLGKECFILALLKKLRNFYQKIVSTAIC